MKKIKFSLCVVLCTLLTTQFVLTACQASKEPNRPPLSEETVQNGGTTTHFETEPQTEPETKSETESETRFETEPETGYESDHTVIPFTPPSGMTLLGDIGQEAPAITVYEFGANSDGIGSMFDHTEDIDIFQRISSTKSELEKTTILLPSLGTNTEAVYARSENTAYFNESMNYYGGTIASNNRYWFSLNSNTGKLYSFGYHHEYEKIDGKLHLTAILDDLDKPFLTKEECTKIAETVFYKEMGASGSYNMRVNYLAVPEYVNGVYEFRFERTINGQETNELVIIDITDRGRLLRIFSNAFGSFDNVTLPEYDEEKAFEAVEYKLADIYKDVLDTKSLYYKADEPVLVRLSDGKIYLKYAVEVQIYTGAGKPFAHDYTNLLVCIS